MSTKVSQKEVTIQGKLGMLTTVRILNTDNKCVACVTEFLAYQK